MKTKCMAAVAALALFSGTAANSQTFTPPTNPYEWSGVVLVNKPPSPAFPCILTVQIDPGPPVEVVSISFTSTGPTPPGTCEAIDVNNLPITPVWNSSTRQLTIPGVYVETPTPGDCAGDVVVQLGPNPNPDITMNSVIPPVAGSACTITSTPSLTLTSPNPGSVN